MNNSTQWEKKKILMFVLTIVYQIFVENSVQKRITFEAGMIISMEEKLYLSVSS